MPFILNDRFTVQQSKLILLNKINFHILKRRKPSVMVNIDYNYAPYIQDLIYGYVLMGSLNEDIVKEFMPSEECAARTINEYLVKQEFVNDAREEYIRNGQNRC
ncbi:hypothetical protein ACYATP_04035 [Lactobacillaceae bacterium Melli_B4]